ncbi:TetR family transcriptional regulator [Glutamicibacter ectropisis]|uniref:TetR family transcriptional regulator n=1 Tax=Glutamicibacter ectropisis TaxID=3046593 RepID=A0AAU6WE96_9MICC
MQQTVDGRVQRGLERRERILDAAVRRFARRGYEGTRIADIAKDAGMTDAGLIHHFPSKEKLFLAVIERREEVYAPVTGSFDSVAEFLHALIASVKAACAEPEYLRFRAMLSGAGMIENNPATAHLEGRLRLAVERLVPLFAEGIKRGELLPDQQPLPMVLHILALNDGLRAQWGQAPDLIDYAGTFETSIAAAYRAFSGRTLPPTHG